MKTILKWGAILFAVLIVLVLLASVALYSNGMEKLTKSFPNILVETVNIPTDSDAVAHGKHVATIWACTKCHGADLGGTLITHDPIDGLVPLLGSIPAPNLTLGKGGIARSYTDADWVRAIRYGVQPDGRAEILMYNYSTLSDKDLGDLIAYLKQVPPADSDDAEKNYGPVVPIALALGLFTPAAERIDHAARRVANLAPSATQAYGQYLASLCAECHGAGLVGEVKKGKQEDFVRVLRTGVLPDGRRTGSAMPLNIYGQMDDTELAALWMYLQSAPVARSQR